MNPSKQAVSAAERLQRAILTLHSIGVAAAVGYARKHLARTQQLYLIDVIKVRGGVEMAAQSMRVLGWTFESALLHLCGPRAVERLAMMSEAA